MVVIVESSRSEVSSVSKMKKDFKFLAGAL